MPVQALGGGRYRWGERGKVYRGPGARAKAARQGRAVLATGWREHKRDARPTGQRQASRTARRALKASMRAEARYVRDLQSILRRVHEAIGELARPHLVVATADRRDARPRGKPDLGDRFMKRLLVYVRGETSAAYDRMSTAVNKKNREGVRLIGIAPVEAGVSGIVDAARDASIQLVENAARDYAEDVRDIFGDPENIGARVEDLAAMLEERAEMSESRAALIARDQTLKLNAALTKHRQTSAGVDSYRWRTSQDERVRPGHAELEGEQFDWDDPPDTGQGELNHPGEDYQCRCTAEPVIDEIEESEDIAAE